MFEWDETKNQVNRDKHGVDFNAVWDVDWSTAIRVLDARANYGEERFVAFGFIGKRLHCVAYTWRGAVMRVISLRKANTREQDFYEEQTLNK